MKDSVDKIQASSDTYRTSFNRPKGTFRTATCSLFIPVDKAVEAFPLVSITRLNPSGWAVGEVARQPVSRVLSAPRRDGTTIPLGPVLRRASRDQPGRQSRNAPVIIADFRSVIIRPPLRGLAPGGVYPATPVARGAVRSCRTVSPLPVGPACLRVLVLRGRSVFCGTIPGVAPAGR